MPKLNFEWIPIKEMLCDEQLLSAVSVWLGRRYEMIFSQFWNFKLLKTQGDDLKSISNKIWIENGDHINLLEKYHGIRVTDIGHPTHCDFVKIVNRELSNGLPVATQFDNRFFPWNKGDGNDEITLCLVTGIDKVKDEILFVDIHNLRKSAQLSIKLFLQGYRNCKTFEIVDNEKKHIDWRLLCMKNIVQLHVDNSFGSMRELADLIAKTDFCERGMDDSGLLGDKIKYVYHSRYLYAQYLDYLVQYCGIHVLSQFSELFIQISNQWLSFWGLITSAMFQRQLNILNHSVSSDSFANKMDKASKKLYHIAFLEENFSDSLESLINGKYIPEYVPQNYVIQQGLLDLNEEISFVDITPYVNNQGFYGNVDQFTRASLTCTGQVFLKDGLPHNNIWGINGMKFRFIEPDENSNDNISCFKQKIALDKKSYSTIMFLGCAEWGHYSELLEIHYLDGKVELVPLEFTDWTYPEAHFNEVVVWEGKCAEKDRNGILRKSELKGHLYAYCVRIKENLKLDYIILPDCANIHLFAISLA